MISTALMTIAILAWIMNRFYKKKWWVVAVIFNIAQLLNIILG